MLKQMIQTGVPYPVYIGHGTLKKAGEILGEALPDLKDKKMVIISDSNVMPLYGNMLKTTLESLIVQSGRNVQDAICTYEIPAGETSKNWSLLGELLEFLAQHEITRSDYLIALGGGVVGDLTGFAASIYLRGISFIQVPTTLLAAVDSSVGGKTAVDLQAGKNLAGTFWQPKAVLCDPDVFSSLSREIFLDGVAESIKYGILKSEKLFQEIKDGGLDSNPESIVATCIAMKGDIVSEDEFDRGTRELLNLGHTFAHAIETCSHYAVSHGHAVAIGMHLAGKAALSMHLCSAKCSKDITNALLTLGFSLDCPYSKEDMLHVMLMDKKRKGAVIDLILPHAIGDTHIHPIPVSELEQIMNSIL